MNVIEKGLSLTYKYGEKIDYESILPIIDFKPKIPKRISQVYISPVDSVEESPLPISIKRKIKLLRETNSGWEYKLYRNEDIKHFIKQNYGELIWHYYERIDPQYCASKADLFRYLLIYKEGGVYLDLKIQLSKPLDSALLPSDKYIISHWDNLPGDKNEGHQTMIPELAHIPRGEYLMGVIISSPGHPFLRSLILKVLENIDTYNPYTVGVGWNGAMRVLGPVPYTLAIHELIEQKANKDLFRQVEIARDFGFEYHPTEVSKALKTDYRKGWKPVIKQRNILSQAINVIYLRLLKIYQRLRSQV